MNHELERFEEAKSLLIRACNAIQNPYWEDDEIVLEIEEFLGVEDQRDVEK